MNIDSHHLKEALMHYFRFKRGWVCADEVCSGAFIGDIVVDSGKWTMEVEVKVTKCDLITGEDKKVCGWGHGLKKHEAWNKNRTNKFALCVPECLKEVAEEWIAKTNKKYGLYIYKDKGWIEKRIFTYKTALLLHKEYKNVDYTYKIARRLSSIRAFELSEINNRKENGHKIAS